MANINDLLKKKGVAIPKQEPSPEQQGPKKSKRRRLYLLDGSCGDTKDQRDHNNSQILSKENTDQSPHKSRQSVDQSTHGLPITVDTSTHLSRQSVDQSTHLSRQSVDEKSRQIVDKDKSTRVVNTKAEIICESSAFEAIDSLSELQLIIASYIIQNAINHGGLITGKMKGNDFCNLLISNGYQASGFKKTIARLVHEKGVFQRHKGQLGPGGFQRFKICPLVRSAYLNTYSSVVKRVDPSTDMRRQRVDKESRQRVDLINSSSFNNITTIKYGLIEKIGFGEGHVKQLQKAGFDPDVINMSIEHLAYGIKSGKTKHREDSDFLELFMSVMMKNEGQFNPPSGFKTAEERAMEFKLQQSKNKLENLEKMRKEQQDIELKAWLLQTPPQEIEDIVPANVRKIEGARKAAIRSHFIKNIFKGVEFDQFRKTEVMGE